MTIEFPAGLPEHFYSGTFPGKKNQGHCRYQALLANLADPEGGIHRVPLKAAFTACPALISPWTRKSGTASTAS